MYVENFTGIQLLYYAGQPYTYVVLTLYKKLSYKIQIPSMEWHYIHYTHYEAL